MKWEAYKKYIIGGAVFAIIAIVIIVLVVSKRQSYVDETQIKEPTLQSSLRTENNVSPTSQDNNKTQENKTEDNKTENQTDNQTDNTIDTTTNGQGENTNAVYDTPVIDFNDLLNLPGNVDTGGNNHTEKTEATNTTEATKETESDLTHEESSTTHADPDGPGWSDWIKP